MTPLAQEAHKALEERGTLNGLSGFARQVPPARQVVRLPGNCAGRQSSMDLKKPSQRSMGSPQSKSCFVRAM
jgi:hypothetical protein